MCKQRGNQTQHAIKSFPVTIIYCNSCFYFFCFLFLFYPQRLTICINKVPRGDQHTHTHTHTRSNPQLAVRLLEANNCCMKTIAAAAEVVAAVVVAAVVVVAWH